MIYGIPLPALTPLGLLCFALAFPYLQMARGKLHPQNTIERMVAAHEREMASIAHDRDEWRSAHGISEQARQISADQVEELLEHARTTDSFIRSLPHPGGQVSP